MSLLRTPPDRAVIPRAGPAPRAIVFAQLFASARGRFFAAIAVLYACAILLTTLTLNAYFAQTWDVATFVQAAHAFLEGGSPFDLYAQSRVAQTWPYAYPPLHALAVALALLPGTLLPILPEYVWARLPTICADIAVALVLYALVERRTGDQTLARVAALVWLFNPVTFYDTAVQGHFESEWLLFVLLAFTWHEEGRGIAPPSLALAIAFLFKQVALLFAIPFWVMLAVGKTCKVAPAIGGGERSLRRWQPAALSVLLFALVVGVVCLPFVLYSDDFLYMNLTYVENMPVQTASWLVGVLGLTRTSPDALTGDFPLLRFHTVISVLAALGISLVAARRGWSLYVAGALIALGFFLTSRKVMGYYYVMLLPFLLVAELPRRRLHLVALAVAALAWMALAPYYAAWTNHAHWWVYAGLGALNSLFFVWMFVQVALHRRETEDENAGPSRVADLSPEPPDLSPDPSPKRRGEPQTVLVLSVGLFVAAIGAALLQPLVSSTVSPIRAPIVPPGVEGNAVLAFLLLLLLLVMIALLARRWAPRSAPAAWGGVFVFAPLFFAVYTLTKESTAILEMALAMLRMALPF